MVKIAIIQFPGTNCEYETQRAVRMAGAHVDIVSWRLSPEALSAYDGVVIPGGFSFQDRVRAGAIAAKLPILQGVTAMALAGKPVLGICNGCQILAEAGLFPMLSGTQVDVAMGHNQRLDVPVGFICEWVYVKLHAANNLFLQGKDGAVLPIQINHGEGRFVLGTQTQQALAMLGSLRYCDSVGNDVALTLNGAEAHLAGLSNLAGNVLALMPHPERAVFMKQLPTFIAGDWADRKQDMQHTVTDPEGPWAFVFQNMISYCQTQGETR